MAYQVEIHEKYELVVGLEVHVQLSTHTKIFSADSAAYGAAPNEHVSAISLGMPGTLPMLNKTAVEYAVKMGLACHCRINTYNTFARKNYFYADLPKGYQVTQDQHPICTGGYVPVKLAGGSERNIAIHHIHMEEDAGKSIHDGHSADSMIDLNRAGVPLLEVVSEPDLRSSEEAVQYLNELRRLVRYLNICDGNMEEGSMRCDANISVKLKGETKLGNRCEVKNLNSIRNVQRAIAHEFERQVKIIEQGGHIEQNTLNFDADTGETSVLRSKEEANDYRYFPEPDLQPLQLTPEYIAQVKQRMPALPHELYDKYVNQLGLPAYDAGVLTAEHDIAGYFEQLIACTPHYKAAANWLMGPVKSYLNEHHISIDKLVLAPARLARVIDLVNENLISHSAAAHQLLPELIKQPQAGAKALAAQLNLLISTGGNELEGWVNEALAKFPDKIKEYQKGKKGVLGLFMGEIMKRSKGKIDPKETTRILTQALEQK
ncbi:Asp-tRNA(Asn)/Glu-tRNA(Gln) amidotransferase subunit GatB [Mucilaginibacter sp.]